MKENNREKKTIWDSFVQEFIRDYVAIREIFKLLFFLSCQTKTQNQKNIHFSSSNKNNAHFLSYERIDRVTCCIFGFAFLILHTVCVSGRVSIHHAHSIAYKNYSLSDTCTVYLGFFSHMLCLYLRHKHSAQPYKHIRFIRSHSQEFVLFGFIRKKRLARDSHKNVAK